MNFEKPPQDNSENIELSEKTTLEKLKELPIYKRVRQMLIYMAVSASLVTIAELTNKSDNSLERDRQEEIQPELDAEQAEKLREQRAYIEKNIGPHVLDFLARRHLIEQKEISNNVDIEGEERFDIEESTLKSLWSEEGNYPKGWINESIEKVRLVGSSDIKKPVYAKESTVMAGGTRENIMNLAVFEDVPQDQKLKSLDWIFSHEIGHLNDWENSSNVNFNERIDLLVSVHKRMNEPNHFEDVISSYDDMKDVGNEEQRQFYLAREYWGNLCEYYFTFPDILKERSPEDFELVDSWVKKRDPQFDPFIASEKRNSLMEQE